DDPWISREHPRHVGPDLNLIRLEGRAHQGSAVVGTTTAKRCRLSCRICPNKPAEHGHHLRSHQRCHHSLRVAESFRYYGPRTAVLIVRHDAVTWINLLGHNALRFENFSEQRTRKQFAIGDYLVLQGF